MLCIKLSFCSIFRLFLQFLNIYGPTAAPLSAGEGWVHFLCKFTKLQVRPVRMGENCAAILYYIQNCRRESCSPNIWTGFLLRQIF